MLFPPDRSMQDSSSSDSPTLSDCRNDGTPSLPRKPIPRKGHTKSRRGCFNCKRRRIKCNERRPECQHCVKAGLQCDYPANIIQVAQRLTASPHPQEAGNLRSTPGMFVRISEAYYRNDWILTITVHGRHALVPPLPDYCVSPFTSRCG